MLSGDKLPALSLPTASQSSSIAAAAPSYRSGYPDPVVPGSNPSSARTSLSGSAAAVNHDNRTPPPSAELASTASTEYPNPVSESYYPAPLPISSMNHTPPYMDVHSSHLSSAQPYASQAATAGGISHYSPYPTQPPVLQPASTTYGPASSYSHYGYPGAVTSPQSATQPSATSMSSQMPAQLLPLPGKSIILYIYNFILLSTTYGLC